MKIILRNFWTMLRRYTTSSLLNVVGLTLAFTAFYIILVQVWWEVRYNRALPDAERIYLVETPDWYEPGRWSAWLNRPVAERVIASLPGVEAGGCLWGGFGEGVVWRQNASKTGYDKFELSNGQVSLPLLDVFSFRSLEGDVHDLKKPRSVALSRSAAETLGVGIGDPLWVEVEVPAADNALEVVAVFADFPDNTLLGECKVVSDLGETSLYSTSEWSFNYFVKFAPGADPSLFTERWTEVSREIEREARDRAAAAGEAFEESSMPEGVRLSPVGRLYFESDSQVPQRQGSLATTYTLLGIAFLTIILAFINFVNFFLALVPVRIRTVNTFKVFGAPGASLRGSFVFEAFGLVAIGLFAACYLTFFVAGTEFAGYISAPLALSRNLPVAGLVVVVAVLLSLAASLYPAWYITSFPPSMVVRGAFGGTRSGRNLRIALLGVQFVIALSLIIATCFIRLQHDYMMHYDMGFDKRDLVAVRVTETAARSYDALRERLLSDPQVKAVTGATSRMVSVGRMGWGREFKGEHIAFESYVVQPDFLHVMGIRIIDGRDFSKDDPQKELGTMIFNEAARRKFGMQVGDRISGFISPDEQIAGFCADFNFKPLQYEVQPFCFYVLPKKVQFENYWHLPFAVYVRTHPGADLSAVADLIRRSVAGVDPHAAPGELKIRTFEEELGQEYAAERRLTAIVGLFALLAVAIALMGVFGIVLFETQHRRREIAVRKVMGATTGEILSMFNRRYATMVVACFVVAAPLGAWGVNRWLETFAYRTPMAWWVFALAFAAVLVVTVLTVTVRTWKAADENPAETVKSE